MAEPTIHIATPRTEVDAAQVSCPITKDTCKTNCVFFDSDYYNGGASPKSCCKLCYLAESLADQADKTIDAIEQAAAASAEPLE